MALPAIDQGTDDVSERGQGQIDLGGLLESHTSRLSLALTLRTGQIDEVELARFESLLTLDL